MTSPCEKAAQLVFARLGSNMKPPVTAEEDADRMKALLDRCPLGGIILFNGSTESSPGLLNELHRRCDRPLLVASDIERGVGQQLTGGSIFPHARALGRSVDLVEPAGAATAREARAAGIHITCMPVADVNRNPKNPIISIRSFGADPDHVSRCASAYIRGCREAGILTAVKHFPGHGNTLDDSHAGLPVVDDDRATVLENDVTPFSAAIAAGVDLVMTAHVAYPALDATRRPATLSPPIIHGLLRDEMGFEGAVITDSLLMGGIKGVYDTPGKLGAALVREGVDILLDPEEPEQMIDGIAQAVEEGSLAPARLDEAFGRVVALKDKMSDRFGPSWATDPLPGWKEEERAAHHGLAWRIARQAAGRVRGRSDALPIPPESVKPEELLVVLVQPSRTHLDPPEQPLGEALREVYPNVRYIEVGPDMTRDKQEDIRTAAKHARHVVAAVVVRPAAWHTYGLREAQHSLVDTLVEENDVVLAALGDPGILDDFPEATLALCTYSDTAHSQRALVSLMLGDG